MARYLLFHNVMNNPFKYILSIAAITAALTLSARADFVKETAPFAGQFLFNDVANHDVSDFDTFVGKNHPGNPTVHVHTTANVTSGSGFANIKPVADTNLTDLIFTPTVGGPFGDFNFRGQLTDGAGGTVTVIVNGTQTFTFTGLGANADFSRIGIIAVAGSGQTIQTVELQAGGTGFKEVKQIRISLAESVPTPDGGATVMLLGAALSVLGMARRYLKS